MAVTGCGDERPRTAMLGPWNRPLAERASDPFPRKLHQSDGTVITIQSPPRRVVSGTILTDGVLLEVCPRERIRALHRISTDPLYSPFAAESAKFPRHLSGEAEPMLAEEPDLVFVASFTRPETRDKLEKSGAVLVRVDDFESFPDIAGNLRMIGYALGLDAAVEQLVAQMEATLEQLGPGRARRSGWRVLLWSDGYSAGRDTLFQAMLDVIGARNAAASLAGHAPLSVERALALDPDVIVVGAPPGQEPAALERLRQTPGLASIRAVTTDRVLVVDSALLAATSQHAALAAKRIADRLDVWGKP